MRRLRHLVPAGTARCSHAPDDRLSWLRPPSCDGLPALLPVPAPAPA